MRLLRDLVGRLSVQLVIVSCFCLQAWFATVSRAAAIAASIDTSKWIGYDGTWSPIVIRVGQPPQWVSVLPSITTSETLVIGTAGCDGTMQCQQLRGGVFASNESSTFASKGTFDLGLDPDLGIGGDGYYGLDTIALSDDISENSQVIGIINSTTIWSGMLGLGIQATTFTLGKTSSFLSSLASGGSTHIPSLSYGYTAGASYALKQVPASLVLGGYDEARFEPNNLSFSLDSNQQPMVSLRSISVNGWTSNEVTLLDSANAGFFKIDSSTPFLWLPESAALKFERTFGLRYDESLQLYFYPNTTQENNIMQAKMTFDFELADLSDSSQSLSISLSGQAFTSLALTYGYPGLQANSTSPPMPYFPVRKAMNSTQYTLGRMFLQETYLIVDYLRNNFSLSQAVFDSNALSDTALVDIDANSTSGSAQDSQLPNRGQALSTGTMVGIAIGVVCFVAIVVGTLVVLYIRRHRTQHGSDHRDSRGLRWLPFPSKYRNNINELPAESAKKPVEVPCEDVKELQGSTSLRAELASTSGPSYSISDHKYKFGVGHDPQVPVELPARTSIQGNGPNLLMGSSRRQFPPSPATLSTSGVSNQSQRISSHSTESSSPLVTPLIPAKRSHGSNFASRGMYLDINDTISSESGAPSPSYTLNDSASFTSRSPSGNGRSAKRI